MNSRVALADRPPEARGSNPLMRRARRILERTAAFEDRFVPDLEELAKLLVIWREMDCAIAMTLGVWDLFHVGHAKYIERGREEAMRLCPGVPIIMVVGVDSDAVTRKRKGPNRPIVPENERYETLSFLRAVDIIVPQVEEDTLHKLIRPDVRIISQSTQDLPGLELMKGFCTHLVNLPPQAETSTTARVRKLSLDGASELGERLTKAFNATLQDYMKGKS